MSMLNDKIGLQFVSRTGGVLDDPRSVARDVTDDEVKLG